MDMDVRIVKDMREEMLREVEANRLSKRIRGQRDSVAAAFIRELRLDFVRLVGVFRGSGKAAAKRKSGRGRL